MHQASDDLLGRGQRALGNAAGNPVPTTSPHGDTAEAMARRTFLGCQGQWSAEVGPSQDAQSLMLGHPDWLKELLSCDGCPNPKLL